MNPGVKDKIQIIEIKRGDAFLPTLKYRHATSSYYDLSVRHEHGAWRIELTLKPLGETIEKKSESQLFSEFVEEPRVFAAELDDEQVGWVELGYHRWNNRMRIWEILVKEEYRRKGIGTMLMERAVKVAKEKGARMLVLETQSYNVSAISFYMKQGFELIGFDAAAYSNQDIERKEVRLEFGLKL
jgi:ribosomal protein S18 acetylase RimI-like enzyme